MTTKVRVLQKDDATLCEYIFKCPRCGSDSIAETRHTDEMRNVNLIVDNHNSKKFEDEYTDWTFIDETLAYKCGNCHEFIATDSPSHLVSAIVKLVQKKEKKEKIDLDKLAWNQTCESNSKCITCVLYDYCLNHTKEDEANDLEARKLQKSWGCVMFWLKVAWTVLFVGLAVAQTIYINM